MLRLLRSISLSLLVGCAPGATPDAGAPRCPLGRAPGEVRVLARGLGGTEGIAFTAEGRLFVTAGEDVVEVLADGGTRRHAHVPSAVGMASWRGALAVASADDGSGTTGAFCDPHRRGGVYQVFADGGTALLAGDLGQPNFLAVTPRGTLLVADDCAASTRLHEVDAAGASTVWLEGVPSANGVAYSPAADALYVASTFTDPPVLWKVPVDAEGRPGTPAQLVTFAPSSTPDGIAVDADGNVYVALNVLGELRRVTPAGEVSLLARHVDFAASLAFGQGPGFEACSLYVTSLLSGEVSEVYVGVPGRPLFH